MIAFSRASYRTDFSVLENGQNLPSHIKIAKIRPTAPPILKMPKFDPHTKNEPHTIRIDIFETPTYKIKKMTLIPLSIFISISPLLKLAMM